MLVVINFLVFVSQDITHFSDNSLFSKAQICGTTHNPQGGASFLDVYTHRQGLISINKNIITNCPKNYFGYYYLPQITPFLEDSIFPKID